MYMEIEDDVRFKVTSVRFNDTPSQEEIQLQRGKLLSASVTLSLFSRKGSAVRYGRKAVRSDAGALSMGSCREVAAAAGLWGDLDDRTRSTDVVEGTG